MKVKLNEKIVDLDGVPIKTDKGDFLLRMVLENALLTDTNEKRVKPDEKVRRLDLALRIHQEKEEIDLGLDDLKMLKDDVLVIYGPLIAGRACKILEGKA